MRLLVAKDCQGINAIGRLAEERRLQHFLIGLSAKASGEAAQRLLGPVLHPRFPRALFGMDELAESFDDDALGPDFDLKPIRKAVADLIESLAKR